MNLKKLCILALALGGLATAIQLDVQARPGGHSPHIMKQLFQDVELNADQKAALQDLRPTKEEQKEMKSKFHDEKGQLNWIRNFVDGTISRPDVLREIEDTMDEKHEHRIEKWEGMLDVLSSIDDSQRAQVWENLSALSEKREHRQEKRAHHGKKGKDGAKRNEFLLEGISLDSQQQQRFSELEEAKREQREHHAEGKDEKHEYMRSFLSGKMSKADILQEIEERHDEHIANRQENAGLWMDFLESLRPEQQQQLIDNLQKKKDSFREKRKEKRQKWQERE